LIHVLDCPSRVRPGWGFAFSRRGEHYWAISPKSIVNTPFMSFSRFDGAQSMSCECLMVADRCDPGIHLVGLT
jgi:hypothetical protein